MEHVVEQLGGVTKLVVAKPTSRGFGVVGGGGDDGRVEGLHGGLHRFARRRRLRRELLSCSQSQELSQ